MKSSTTPSFRRRFLELPPEIRRLARKNFKLWRQDPRHPSLHFKRVGDFWSARVGRDYRARFRLLYTFDPPNRVGEIDPPAIVALDRLGQPRRGVATFEYVLGNAAEEPACGPSHTD